MKLHTVIVSYNRPELLKRTIESYCSTVTLPNHLMVVDNSSNEETRALIHEFFVDGYVDMVCVLEQNRYPGFATNEGFTHAPADTTLLHRSDNDVEYLPGWCDEVVARFQDADLWQLGLRTVEEEGPHPNVGGNCVLRAEAWASGIRYSGEPWDKVPFEDTQVSQRIKRAQKKWARVQRPCIVHIGIASRDDPYYQETFAVRRITFEMYGL